MKRPVMKIISIALATSLLTATAASAAPRNTGNYRAAQTHNNGNAVALGFGLFALGALAIIASQSKRNDRYDDRYYAPPPPPQYGNRYYGPSSYGRSSYSRSPYGQTSYGPPADYYDSRANSGYDSYGYRR